MRAARRRKRGESLRRSIPGIVKGSLQVCKLGTGIPRARLQGCGKVIKLNKGRAAKGRLAGGGWKEVKKAGKRKRIWGELGEGKRK